ncbi:MAG: YlmH/Sll1252 family protein, partial [Oscillospiraceae bacterium]
MNIDAEDKLIISRAEDAIQISEKRYSIKSIGFLSPHQRVVIQNNLHPPLDINIAFFGGFDGAERTLFVSSPEYLEVEYADIISVLEITGRDISELSHRDFLGSLLSLGIKREKIGDILPCGEKAFVFVRSDIAEYIVSNMNKIGNRGIHVKITDPNEAQIPEKEIKEISGTVSSLRLDSVLALAMGTSRSKVVEIIKSDKVSVNWEASDDVSLNIKENDIISVRGFGRIKLSHVGGITRKGRHSIIID